MAVDWRKIGQQAQKVQGRNVAVPVRRNVAVPVSRRGGRTASNARRRQSVGNTGANAVSGGASQSQRATSRSFASGNGFGSQRPATPHSVGNNKARTVGSRERYYMRSENGGVRTNAATRLRNVASLGSGRLNDYAEELKLRKERGGGRVASKTTGWTGKSARYTGRKAAEDHSTTEHSKGIRSRYREQLLKAMAKDERLRRFK